MDDSKTIVYALDATSSVRLWLKTFRPSLIVRCKEKETDVYVITGGPASVESGASDDHAVRVRIDDEPAETDYWGASTSDDSLFSADAVELGQRLAKARTFRIEWTPFNASPVIATFDVRGFDLHAPELAKACNWPPPAERLRVKATVTTDGVNVVNETKKRAEDCTVVFGSSVGRFPTLEPEGQVALRPSDFNPRWTPTESDRPLITCIIGKEQLTADVH